MKIRSVLSAALITVAATFTSAQAFAEDTFTLKMAETWGPNFPIFGDTTKNFAKSVETMSNGRLKIRIDSANKHKAPLGVFDMVKAGQYDMGHSASYYWKGKVPETLFFTSMKTPRPGPTSSKTTRTYRSNSSRKTSSRPCTMPTKNC